MKLIRCYIENFGGLHQTAFRFEDGMTVIHAPNGFGKTTLAEFIRAMFYGFPRAGKDPKKNLRQKYLPWQGGRCGGYLIFEHKGTCYRIERSFGDTPKGDRFKLYNEDTHRESKDFDSDIGTQLFGLDSESFQRSTYMPQMRDNAPLSTNSIRAKLGNLLEDTDDVGSYEAALARLKDRRSSYEHFRGSGGSIHETQKQITALQNRLDDCKNKSAELEQITADIARYQQQKSSDEQALHRIRNQLTDASSALAKAAAVREYEHLTNRSRDIQARLQTLAQRYPKGLPTQAELDTVSHCLDEIHLLKTGLQEAPPDFSAEQTVLPPKTLHSSFLPLLLLGILTAAVGTYLLIQPTLPEQLAAFAARYQAYLTPILANRIPIGSICWITATVSFMGGIILQIKHTLRRKMDAVHAAAEAQRAEQWWAAIEATERKLTALQTELTSFNRSYGLQIHSRASLRTVERDREQSEKLVIAASRIRQAQKRFLAEHGEQAPSPSPDTNHNIDRLKAAERQLIAAHTAHSARLLQLEQRRQVLQAEVDRLPELTDRLQQCIRQKEDLTDRRRLLDETIGYLQKARESLSHTYLGSVQTSFARYLNQLTGEKTEHIAIDPDLEVSLERSGSAHPISSFSAGETDLVQLCMRLALSDALFEDEPCFLILDDPFVNLDDEHTRKAIDLLQKLSEHRQIIYLVCNQSRL